MLTNNEVINIVASAPRRSKAAKMVVRHAVATWRYKYPNAKIDDCAVICLFFNEPPPLTNSPTNRNNTRQKKQPLSPHGSKPNRTEDTETCLDDGKSSIIDLGQELNGFGGLSRANSVTNSKHPRISRAVSRRQSSTQYADEVEVH